ncbi:MAG: hypothetical protein JWR84_991 [Caulobacter sp.]|nr:hypothetical protein [Caulobacter sp.]
MSGDRPGLLISAWRLNARVMQVISIILALVCLSSLVHGVAVGLRTGDWSGFVSGQWLAVIFLLAAATVFSIAGRFAKVRPNP